MKSYIATQTNETIIVIENEDGKITQHSAKKDHPKWNDIVAAFKVQNNELLMSLISLKSVIEHYSVGNLSVNSTGVTFGGKPLHTVDAARVMAFLKEGLPYQPIANYIEKKLANTSMRAVNEMYNFLEHMYMPLTPNGNFIAYKGVRKDYYSKMGNTETIVIKGKVDAEGHIFNGIGEEIEILRSCVSDDFRNPCGPGLHAGSLQYALDWAGSDGLVILIEINPADVVSIPEDCSHQKLRCCKYKVIGEYSGKLPKTYTNEFEATPSTDNEETSKYANDVHKRLQRDEHGRFVKTDLENVVLTHKCGCEEGSCVEAAADEEVEAITSNFPNEIDSCCGNCSECECSNTPKSKFANDTHKKLKRDSNGRFIKSEHVNSYDAGFNKATEDYNNFNEPMYVYSNMETYKLSCSPNAMAYIEGYVEGWARSSDANPH